MSSAIPRYIEGSSRARRASTQSCASWSQGSALNHRTADPARSRDQSVASSSRKAGESPGNSQYWARSRARSSGSALHGPTAGESRHTNTSPGNSAAVQA